MSIQEQITRIEQDKILIRNKMVELGKATATDNLDVLAQAVDDITKQAGVTATVKEGETYTIPEGYHDGSGTVSGIAGGGNYSLQSKTVTPTKKQQSITSDDEYYGLSDVVVAAIPDAYQDVTSVTAGAADVLTGKNIVDSKGAIVAGTMVNNGAVAKTLDTETTEYAVPVGYHNGLGKVSVVTEEKSVTPTKAEQKINATTGKVIKSVTVAAIPDEYQNVTSVTAGAADVLAGKVIVDAEGTEVTGSMPNNGDVTGTIDGLTTMSVEIPAGYTTGGTITLTGDIEAALAAI